MIQGLTDKNSLTPRLPRLGRLRKGGAKQEKNGKSVFGKDLEYFRFTSENPAVVSAFTKEYHEQPNNLHVFMPFATRDECFPTWKEAWDASTLLHRCDGRTCEIWWDAQRKVYSREPKPCPGGCKEVGRLEVVLPELFRSGFVGTVTMETHGKNDMMAIASCLDKVEIERTEHGLDLRGVGFILRRHNESISTPGWGDNAGKRQRVVKSLVSLEPVAAWAEKVIALADGAKPAEIAATSSFAVKDGRTYDTATGEVLDSFEDEEVEEGDFTSQTPVTEPITTAPQPGNGAKPASIPITPIVVKQAAPPTDMSAEPMLTSEDEFERMESASDVVMITKAQIKDLGRLLLPSRLRKPF